MNQIFSEEQKGLPGCEYKEGPWVHISIVMEWYGVTDRAIQLWAEKGYIPKSQNGMYHLPAVVKGLYGAQLEIINKKKGPDGNENIDLLLREQRAKTEKAELELEKMKGDLVNKNEVEKIAFEKARIVREAIENIPQRIAPILAAEADIHQCRETLKKELKNALEELSV